jgi:hypothetical protein
LIIIPDEDPPRQRDFITNHRGTETQRREKEIRKRQTREDKDSGAL